VIEIEDLRMRCQKCQQEFSKEKWDLTCPFCGSFETEVLSGEEMLLKSLELVDED
jgi:hydrogenase nickel incorporation protein HypA/HybF